jgi:4-hydroxyphenylpyruvate dioxygenase-like putative hemolysin
MAKYEFLGKAYNSQSEMVAAINAYAAESAAKATADAQAKLAAKEAELAAKTTARTGTVSLKSTTANGKGNIGVYGVQRMPVTLYPAQWVKLFQHVSEFAGIIIAHAGTSLKDSDLDFQTEQERESVLAWARGVAETAGNAGQ